MQMPDHPVPLPGAGPHAPLAVRRLPDRVGEVELVADLVENLEDEAGLPDYLPAVIFYQVLPRRILNKEAMKTA